MCEANAGLIQVAFLSYVALSLMASKFHFVDLLSKVSLYLLIYSHDIRILQYCVKACFIQNYLEMNE